MWMRLKKSVIWILAAVIMLTAITGCKAQKREEFPTEAYEAQGMEGQGAAIRETGEPESGDQDSETGGPESGDRDSETGGLESGDQNSETGEPESKGQESGLPDIENQRNENQKAETPGKEEASAARPQNSEKDKQPQTDIREEGSYTSKEEVSLYLHLYGHLPDNYITKSRAQDLGWDSKEGNLDQVAPGKSIGGSRFGNYEGLLPEEKGRKYYECDLDYEGGYRGAKRLIYSSDGLIFYTEDHYKTFEQLY